MQRDGNMLDSQSRTLKDCQRVSNEQASATLYNYVIVVFYCASLSALLSFKQSELMSKLRHVAR
jgi:hypothetical protein